MENITTLPEFLLLGLSEIPRIQSLLVFLCFSLYWMTLTGNIMVMSMIISDRNLHSPMYFFLGNLALLDIASSNATVPRLLYDYFREKKTISITSCLVQLFFFLTFVSTETFLLAAMSYDRYIAICLPLRYHDIMKWTVCTEMAILVWVIGILYSLLYTLSTLNLSFCGPNTIGSFFCDLRQLLQLSCSNNFINILLIFIFGGSLGLAAFLITFLPYIRIIITVLRIKTNEGRQRAFSTCTSHLTIVLIFYSTSAVNYFYPSNGQFSLGRHLSVVYTIIVPMLNPLVYSLRNNDLKRSFRRSLIIKPN